MSLTCRLGGAQALVTAFWVRPNNALEMRRRCVGGVSGFASTSYWFVGSRLSSTQPTTAVNFIEMIYHTVVQWQQIGLESAFFFLKAAPPLPQPDPRQAGAPANPDIVQNARTPLAVKWPGIASRN